MKESNYFKTIYMDTVEVHQVIITTLTRRGNGVKDSPIRVITQIWDMEGNMITEIDPHLQQKFEEFLNNENP